MAEDQRETGAVPKEDVDTEEGSTEPPVVRVQPGPVEPALNPGDAMRRVEEAMARLPVEPALVDLARAALRKAEADPESVARLKRTALAAAAMPSVKITVDRDVGRGEKLDRYQDDPDRWGADAARSLGVSVSAEWNLSELVFNPDVVRVHDLLADRAERRESVLSLLAGYYFERRRLMLLELLVPAVTPEEALERRVRIEELSAVIDALTGGLLSRNLRRQSAR